MNVQVLEVHQIIYLCQGPHKFGTLHLRFWYSLRDLVEKEKCKVTLPQDWAPNKVILRQTVKVNTERAMRLRGTIFVRSLLHQPNGVIVARVITQSRDAEVRCWMQCITGTYPVASYLHLIGKVTSKLCQHCRLDQLKPCITSSVSALVSMMQGRCSQPN